MTLSRLARVSTIIELLQDKVEGDDILSIPWRFLLEFAPSCCLNTIKESALRQEWSILEEVNAIEIMVWDET